MLSYPLKFGDVIINVPSISDMKVIRKWIDIMYLDDTNLKRKQFLTAYKNGKILGFGRIIKYKEYYQLASLAVLPEYQGKGLSKLLIQSLLSTCSNKPVYIVTAIPDLFKKFGFEKTSHCPPPILKKITYCIECINVNAGYPYEYVVMVKNK